MNEKHMQSLFGNYLKKNPPNCSEVYELKYTKGTSIPFANIKEHQAKALLDAEENSLYHKISDPPVFYGMNTRFNAKRPFDCFCLVNVKSFVVVWFYTPRQRKLFIKIGIKTFLKLKENSDRKSFTEKMAIDASTKVINISEK